MVTALVPNANLTSKGPHWCMKNPEHYDGPRYTTLGGEIWSQYWIATRSLDEGHFGEDDCCTPTNPCTQAARFMLATGRVAGTRGYIPAPHGGPTPRIAPAATGNGEPLHQNGTLQADAPDPQPQGNGNSATTKGRKASSPNGPTEPQIAHLIRMSEEITELDDKASKPMTREIIQQLTIKEASNLIDVFQNVLKDMRRQHREKVAKVAEKDLEEQAFYRTENGEVYRTRRAKGSGRLYAMKVIETEDDAELAYARGAISKLRAEHRLSQEESLELAERLGRKSGQCCVCDRKLTNPESRKLGIGPVCRNRA